jgi:hypothetical protein
VVAQKESDRKSAGQAHPLLGLLTAQALGAFNDNAWKQVVVLLVMSTTASAAVSQQKAALAQVVLLVPLILFNLPGGMLADRYSKRRVIVATKGLELLLMLAGTAVVLFQPSSGLLALVILGMLGVQAALFGPSKYGFLPEILPHEKLSAGNGLLEMWTNLAMIAGTVAGGGIVYLSTHLAAGRSWLGGLALVAISAAGLNVEAREERLLLTARPSYNTGTGFYVVGREIYDANGNKFDIRGFSNTHWWGNTADSFNAISEFPKTKANAVRAVFGPGFGAYRPAERQQVVEEYIKNGIVPIVEDHGATVSEDPVPFRRAVDRWLDPANVQWLKQYEKYVILNIANEWGPNSTVWRDEYINAVARIRAAGINCLLMIDAGGLGGQDIRSIDTWWNQIEGSDPQHNIVFSIHMYRYWVSGDKPGTNYAPGSWGNGMPEDIKTELDKAVQMNIPLVVGEFSWQGGDVNYKTSTAMKLFSDHDIGWLAWSWNWNRNPAYDMIANGGWQYTSGASLTAFGNLVINDPVCGLKATSKQATIFANAASSSATFIASDTITQRNWKGRNGIDGYNIIGDQANCDGR